MKSDQDPDRLDALGANEADLALARALKELAHDRPRAGELARVRMRLQQALRQQVAAQEHAMLLQPAASLIVVGAALLSMLPAPTRQLSHVVSVRSTAIAPVTPQAVEVEVAPRVDPLASADATLRVSGHSPAPRVDLMPSSVAASRAGKRPRQLVPNSVSRGVPPGSGSGSGSKAAPDVSTPLQPTAANAVAKPAANSREATRPVTHEGARADEVTLLQRAHENAAGDPRMALHWLDEHKRHFPHGMLTQERELYAIQLLRALARDAEAAQRVEAFRRDFPHSLYLSRLGGAK